MKPRDIHQAKSAELRGTMAAMQRAARVARETAIQTNTALIVMQDGKVVEVSPEELRHQAETGQTT